MKEDLVNANSFLHTDKECRYFSLRKVVHEAELVEHHFILVLKFYMDFFLNLIYFFLTFLIFST